MTTGGSSQGRRKAQGGGGPGKDDGKRESAQPSHHQPACVACRESRVFCDKTFPCERCRRLSIDCVPQQRGRGRPPGAFTGIVALRKSLEEQETRAREAPATAQTSHDGHAKAESAGRLAPGRARRGPGDVSTDLATPRLRSGGAVANVAAVSTAARDRSPSREHVNPVAVAGADGDVSNRLGPSTASPPISTTQMARPLTSPTAATADRVGSDAIKEACHVLVALQMGARQEQRPPPQSGVVRQLSSPVGQESIRHAGAPPPLTMPQGLDQPKTLHRPPSESPVRQRGGASCPHDQGIHALSSRGLVRQRSRSRTPPRAVRQPVMPTLGPARPPLPLPGGEEGREAAGMGDPEWPIGEKECPTLMTELTCKAVLRLQLSGRVDQSKIDLVMMLSQGCASTRVMTESPEGQELLRLLANPDPDAPSPDGPLWPLHVVDPAIQTHSWSGWAFELLDTPEAFSFSFQLSAMGLEVTCNEKARQHLATPEELFAIAAQFRISPNIAIMWFMTRNSLEDFIFAQARACFGPGDRLEEHCIVKLFTRSGEKVKCLASQRGCTYPNGSVLTMRFWPIQVMTQFSRPEEQVSWVEG